MGHALHQTAITQKHPRVMINNGVARAIELSAQGFFRDRHAHSICQTLAQGPRSCLNAGGITVLRMTGRLTVQLPELLDVFNRQLIPAQVQKRINEHRPMTI